MESSIDFAKSADDVAAGFQESLLATKDHESSKILIDSLPYIDPVDDDYEQYALALIEDEMQSKQTLAADSVRITRPVTFRTDMMRKEFESYTTLRLGGNTTRSHDEESISSPKISCHTVGEWREAVHRARINYEVERIRSMQLEIEKDGEGCAVDSWKYYIETSLSPAHLILEQYLTAQKNITEHINFERQNDQQKYGQLLNRLKSQYDDLVSQHFQLKHATITLEKEILELEAHRTEGL